MDALESLASEWAPAVCRLSVEFQGKEHGTGTGFLTAAGLVSASHVVDVTPNGLFKVASPAGRWELSTNELRQRVTHESPEHVHDYAVVSLKGAPQEIIDIGTVEIAEPEVPPVGRRVAYLGYPFGADSLVVSNGYVSSLDRVGECDRIRIDGSVNRGNSGGPVIDLVTNELVAIVTRAETGFIIQQFRELQTALQANVKVLSDMPQVMSISGFDPVDGIRATMAAVAEVTRHLERSANVGIGYAFGVGHLARALRG